jgi:hypothetical protein
LVRVVVVARVQGGVRWRPAGAAVTFFLAAVAGVAGNRLTGHLTPALVAFGVLMAAGMTVTYLLEAHAGRRRSDDGEAATGGPGRGHDLRGAQGVQFGDRNQQVNYFADGPEQDRRE